MPLIVDAHEDLAWNILTLGRDYIRSAAETRLQEQNTPNPSYNGDTLLGWPDYQRGQVAVIFATLFAAPRRRDTPDWEILSYADFNQAYHVYHRQIDAYHRLAGEKPDYFRLVQNRGDLEAVLAHWQSPPEQQSKGHPVGLCILMEGADGIRSPDELEDWWQWGVRIIGLAWGGTRYSGGSGAPGPLTPEGRVLLEAMADLGFVLDLSHMDEEAALQSLDLYPGRIIASHANAVSMLKGYSGNRQLSDRVIHCLLERDGRIGIVEFNRFLKPDWKNTDGKQAVSLGVVVDQIDYICQLAGDARHVGLGSDFDGGFGLAATPAEIDTVADLQKLTGLLGARGYSAQDIEAILSENWLSLLREALP